LVAGKNEKYAMKGFPVIYMIDCTSNECHHLLKSAGMVILIFNHIFPSLKFAPSYYSTNLYLVIFLNMK